MFGLHQYGVDINGFVRHPDRGFCLWMQKRAKTKQTWPDMWDNFVRLIYFTHSIMQHSTQRTQNNIVKVA